VHRGPLTAALATLVVAVTLGAGLGIASSPVRGGPGGDGGTQLPVTVDQYSAPAAAGAGGAGGSTGAGRSSPSRGRPIAGSSVTGILRARGPLIRDRFGRVVLLHGVNAVYKRPPYRLTVNPGEAASFTAADARTIASLGFNVVRLGILWQGLEPGTTGPNDPAVCAPGSPSDPHMYDPAIAQAYLGEVGRVVALLGRFHIYTLLDMHQDVYNQAFRGEGAPAWAVCAGLVPLIALGGRWSANYGNPALQVAVGHFWANDVVGDLQGEFDRVWTAVARYFAANPWILGYDPLNEPFAQEVTLDGPLVFATLLECFYTGTAHPGRLDNTDAPLTCPTDDPARGLIGSIESVDHNHLVFVEPDIYSIRARPNLLGPMPFPRLVLNFHAYCGTRSPVTGDPTNVDACADQVSRSILRRVGERAAMASPYQPGGPPLFLSEFGATGSTAFVDQIIHYTDLFDLGWTYWAWKYYDDPTGSSNEALAAPDGQLSPSSAALSRPYAQAVAGTPVSTAFDAATRVFRLSWVPWRTTAPTIVYVPAALHFPGGYCTTVIGGRILSAPGSGHLLVANGGRAGLVDVTVAPGRCPRPTPAGGGRGRP
jgi:endoglycosylceramidase